MKLTMTRPMITKKAIIRYEIVVHSTSYLGPRSDGGGGVPMPKIPLPDTLILHQKRLDNQASSREAGNPPFAAGVRFWATGGNSIFKALWGATGMTPRIEGTTAGGPRSAKSQCGDLPHFGPFPHQKMGCNS